MIDPTKRIHPIVRFLALGLCVSLAFHSSFAEAAAKKKKKKRRRHHWHFEQNYTLLGTVQKGDIIEEKTNPQNSVYQLPTTTLITEFRPELKATYTKVYKVVLRPRAQLIEEMRDKNTPEFKKQTQTSKVFLNEGYLAAQPSDEWQFVTGYQNFQWGPAELASPSNPIFRDLGLNKTYFFETRGHALVRMNYAPSAQTSIIAMVEPTANDEERPPSDKYFRKKAVLKAEYSDESQTNYLGFVLTGAEQDPLQEGLYGHYEIMPGFSAYFDAGSRIGSRTFYGASDTGAVGFAQSKLSDGKRYNTELVGFRYTTEGGWDYRLEALQDDTAWTLEERDQAKVALALGGDKNSILLYTNPGSLFPGQKFAYLSLRIPDWGYENHFTLSLRGLHSLADSTEKLQANLDAALTDHLVMSTSVNVSNGPSDGELTQGYAYVFEVSAAWIF